MHGFQMAELDASLRLKSLKDCVNMFGNGHNFTRLCPDLENVDPDDAFSIVPYEKGFHLLRYLERRSRWCCKLRAFYQSLHKGICPQNSHIERFQGILPQFLY